MRPYHGGAACFAIICAIFLFASAGSAWAYAWIADPTVNSNGSLQIWVYLNQYCAYSQSWLASNWNGYIWQQWGWQCYWISSSLMNAGIGLLCVAGILEAIAAILLMSVVNSDSEGVVPASVLVNLLAFCCAIAGTICASVGVQNEQLLTNAAAVFPNTWSSYYRPGFGLAIFSVIIVFFSVCASCVIAADGQKAKDAAPSAAADGTFSGSNPNARVQAV